MSPLIVPLVAVVGYLLSVQEQPADRVVLLPQSDGRPSAVVVKSAKGETVLDRPYAAVAVGSAGTLAVGATDAEAVRARYGAALAAHAPRPVSYVVYFVTGKEELTPESGPELDQVKAELLRRPAPEIAVIGHTDSVGSAPDNDALSLRRARFVRDVLVAAGIDATGIETAGRGERELLVPTADGVAEPKNRRVEINVR